MCSSLHPLERQALFSPLEKKNGGILNRITAAVHTCVSPQDPKAFTNRTTAVSLRSAEHHVSALFSQNYYYYCCRTPTICVYSAHEFCLYYHYRISTVTAACGPTASITATISKQHVNCNNNRFEGNGSHVDNCGCDEEGR